MKVNQLSTTTSTNFKKAISQAESDLVAAQTAGARNETIKSLEKKLQGLKKQAENEIKYRDIRFLKEWPDGILITHYEEVCQQAKNYIDNTEQPTLMDTPEKKKEYQRYLIMIKLIEKLEDEGRKREIVYFLPDEQIKAIFGAPFEKDDKQTPPTTVTNQTRGKR